MLSYLNPVTADSEEPSASNNQSQSKNDSFVVNLQNKELDKREDGLKGVKGIEWIGCTSGEAL